MNSCFRTMLSLVILAALGSTASSCATVHTGPSAVVQIALQAKMPPIQVENKTLHDAVGDLRRSLGKTSLIVAVRAVVKSVDETRCEFPLPGIGIEYLNDDSPRITLDIPAGTLEQQLNQLTHAYKYSWVIDGDWINLVSADVAEDPKYVFNLRIPEQVISRDSTKMTDLSGWYREHELNVAVVMAGRQTSKFDDPCYKPGDIKDTIVLKNATYRQGTNAHYTIYGKNLWTARLVPSKAGEGVTTQPYKYEIIYQDWYMPN